MAFMAAAAPALMLAGTVVSAGSSILSGFAQSAAMRSQANAARYNQQIAEQNAMAIEKAGEYQEGIQREKNQRLLASQKVGFAKGGVTLEGTPLDVLGDTAAMMEKDIIASRYNTDVNAWRQRSQAGVYGMEAERYDSMAGSALIGAGLGAGSTLLTGAARYYKPELFYPSSRR